MTGGSVDADRALGTLVERNPEFARVFESLGIDFCCGGNQTLREACSKNQLELDTVRSQLADARGPDADERDDWESMTGLVEYVVDTHHRYLDDELPSLERLIEKVEGVHADRHPELTEIKREFRELAAEMRQHTDEEEADVFPVIKELDRGVELTDPKSTILHEALDNLVADHEATAAHIERIADLSDDYEVPDDACPSYRSMLERLERLEQDTHMHVHKENNVLFPRVESRLSETV